MGDSAVGGALRAATERLAAAGIETAALDAQLLLAHVLRVNRAWLLGHPEAGVSPAQAAHLARLLSLREMRRPLAYLSGQREFYGLDFHVDKRVLIPRPETELLVERAIELIQTWHAARGEWPVVADIGTGSGAIAVSVALSLPRLPLIAAVDCSLRALDVAEGNANRHGVVERIEFLCGDLLLPLTVPVDIVLANLPYIATDAIAKLAPEVQAEPVLALDGGVDGLFLFRRFFEQVPGRVNPGGVLLLEVGAGQGAAVAELARPLVPEEVRVASDYAGHDRVVEIHLGREGDA